MAGNCVLRLTTHTNLITSVCFSPDGLRLASCSYDTTVCVWNVRAVYPAAI